MLGKCANPDCDSQFRSLRDGKLFHVEASQHDAEALPHFEHFWLCENCARKFTLVAGTQGLRVIAGRAKAGQ